jgi:hypothetical protein
MSLLTSRSVAALEPSLQQSAFAVAAPCVEGFIKGPLCREV